MLPGSSRHSSAATPQGVWSPTAMFGAGLNWATWTGPVTGTAQAARVTVRARRAATRPISGSGTTVSASFLVSAVHRASSRTRAAASARRSSGSSPERTAATSASRRFSTVRSSHRPPPTQMASAPAAIARTTPCSRP